MASLVGDALEGHIDLVGEVLQKGQVRNTRNRRACRIRYMNVDEARGVCRFVVSVYLH